MDFCTLSLVMLFCQTQPTLKLTDGSAISGTILSGETTRWVLQSGPVTKTFPMEQVLSLEFSAKPQIPVTYCEAILIDGTRILGKSYLIRGGNLEWVTPNLDQWVIPLGKVASLLRPGHDATAQTDWKSRLVRPRKRDVLAIVRKDPDHPEKSSISGLEGTLGVGSSDGISIGFTPAGGKTELPVPQANLHGMLWLRGPDATLLAPLCRLEDTGGQILEIGKIRSASSNAIAITLVCGIDLDLPMERVLRLDFSRGKLAWLSDMDWLEGAVTGFDDRLDRVRRNTNPDGGGIKMGGVPFQRGLAMPSATSLSYALGGEYRELQALVGLDDATGIADGLVRLRVEGDGKTLAKVEISRSNRSKPEKLAVNLKDVQVLKLLVESTDLSPFGRHIILANPKISR